jgi:protein-tyrosine-phosphatase
MNVLFVCTANAGRSVLSQYLLERQAAGRHHARSAGSNPGDAAHPQVVQALHEVGIDASRHVPQKLTPELVDWADVVVATCDDSCPYVPGKRYRNWQLPDPGAAPVERVRELRDDIADRVEALVLELDAESGPAPGPAGPFAS